MKVQIPAKHLVVFLGAMIAAICCMVGVLFFLVHYFGMKEVPFPTGAVICYILAIAAFSLAFSKKFDVFLQGYLIRITKKHIEVEV